LDRTRALARRGQGARVHDDPADESVVLRVEVEHQKRSLSGNDDTGGLVEGEALRRLPALAGQELVGAYQQAPTLLVVKQLPDVEVPLNDLCTVLRQTGPPEPQLHGVLTT
jgi:hypothetical protein